VPETKPDETGDRGAQLDRKDRQRREEVRPSGANDQESPEGRDVPPADAGRDPKSPWLGGG
jgi:hypothetical protein